MESHEAFAGRAAERLARSDFLKTVRRAEQAVRQETSAEDASAVSDIEHAPLDREAVAREPERALEDGPCMTSEKASAIGREEELSSIFATDSQRAGGLEVEKEERGSPSLSEVLRLMERLRPEGNSGERVSTPPRVEESGSASRAGSDSPVVLRVDFDYHVGSRLESALAEMISRAAEEAVAGISGRRRRLERA